MVNVDVSPSVILGVGLIGSGVSLWQIRQTRPWISKDYDVVISCISLLVGGILIFQGWRLDPLLLFGQLMTTGAALSFAVEALRLRNEVYEQEEKSALKDAFDRRGAGPADLGQARLPAGDEYYAPPPPLQRTDDYDDDEYRWPGYGEDESRDAGYPGTSYGYGSIGRRQQQQGGRYSNDGYIEADYYDPSIAAGVNRYGNDDDEYEEDEIERFYNTGRRSTRGPMTELGDDDDWD